MPKPDLERICARMKEIADRKDVDRFLMGTTVDLTRCLKSLRAEDIVSLHDADTPEEAVEVEDALLARFGAHPKCSNEGEPEPDTDTLDGSGVLSVFVAVWGARRK
jgi:hypothetical protein